MDYDDSDTQGHNHQLAGEGRSKSSSVPRPYAFPRFEFEDSLQGHLRFDSLVESEVFHGIQSQDDNQWMEDFSRGSNVIEFSSSATESCSINRRNNVWSEATSLESVELLLKSVGQEQIVPKDTVTENSITFNELGDLTRKMERKSENDNVNSEYMGISDASMPQEELLSDISELENHVEGKLSQVEVITLSHVHLVQKHESSSQMRVDILEEECRATATEGDLLLGTECGDKNEQGVQCIVHETMNRSEDGSSHTVVSAQAMNFITRTLGSSNSPDQLSSHDIKGAHDLVRVACDDTKEQFSSQEMADADIGIMDHHKVDHASHNGDVSCSFSLSVECADKETGAEVIINANTSSVMSHTQQCQSQLQEKVGRDSSLTSPSMLGGCLADVFSSGGVVTAALTGNDTLTEKLELHTSKSNSLNAEKLSTSEPKMDSILQLDQKSSNEKVDTGTESSHKEGGPGDVSGTISPSPLIKGEDAHSSIKITNANILDAAESLGFPVSSPSIELTKEIGEAESIKDLYDASPVIVDECKLSNDSKESFEDEAEIQLSNVQESGDVSLDAKKEENITLCTDAIDKNTETCAAPTCDQKMELSTITGTPSCEETIVNQPQPGILARTEPETNFISCKRNNDDVEKENTEDMHEQSLGRESSHADEEEESGVGMSIGASSSTLSRSGEVAAEVDNPGEAKFDTCHDSTASQLPGTEGNLIPVSQTPDTEGKLIPVVETCNAASVREYQTVKLSDCSKEMEVLPGCDSSLLNKGNVAVGVSSAADPLRAACNSPTIISSDVQIPDERKQEGVGGSEFENKLSTSEDLKVQDTSEDDGSFTFKVNSLPDAQKVKDNNWTPFPIAAMHKSSVVLEGVTTPDVEKIQARLPPETTGRSSPGDHAHVVSKTTSGRKRRASGKGPAKDNSQTGLNRNEITPDKPSRKRGNFSSVSLSPGSSLPGQLVALQPHTEQKSKRLSTAAATATSDLPDLNALALKNHASPSTAFQQSFTDLQQVQLRAQIFVYGSLIQGTAPDEACMISAFGSSDRERGLWEPVWQAAMERARSIKSQSMGESPMNSHTTGAKVPPDVAGKSPQSMVFQSPISRAGSKANPTTVLGPIMPLSSPLWSISTPFHDVSQLSSQQRRPILDYQPAGSPLHPYQMPPVRNIVGHTTWSSQAPCSPSLWASQTPPLSVNVPFTTTSVNEKMKLSPAKDLPFPAPPSCVKDAPSTPMVPTSGSGTVFPGSSQVPDQTKSTLSSEKLPSADPKPRRRKKSQASNDAPNNSLLPQSRSESIAASPPPALAPPAPVTTPACHVTTWVTALSTPQVQVGRLDVGTASACSEDTLGKVTDAKLQAEEASVSAAIAISHCQGLWSQLAKLEPGAAQEAEVKMAAAAGAAAAAACVAKAAAAAARVASNAALQAKLMADEALVTSRMAGGAQTGNLGCNLHGEGSATPASILTGDGVSAQSSSILVAAREAAKRRIEAASAAAKQAENLDAIVKAAELAAEAVSQAGKIVAMGDPLPLKELINVGPEGYWKLSQASSKVDLKSGNGNKERICVDDAEGAMISSKENISGPSGVKGNKVVDQGKTLPGELSIYSIDDNGVCRNADAILEPTDVCEEDLGVGKSHEVPDMDQGKSSGAASVQGEHEELGIVQGNNIKEGSIVEVYKDNDGLKPAWFSASVLTLQDGKALVHYASLLSKEGHDNLKEWVSLEGEGGKAPRIRPVLPIIGPHWPGNKKRRRSAMGNYTWTVRDMVDVSIQDSWWEGIVTEKNEKDETTLTVHFPARGETSAVSVQQLRPSRIWSNGSWVEWSRLRELDHSTESDMPLEKRPRLQSPSRSSKGKDQSLAEAEPLAGKHEEFKLQALSASDVVFNVGKSAKAETKPDVRRPLRTGLQKEKSRVVFGVPKPGKKQKFMEVSKHFPANQNRKDNETKDSVKFAKYLMPQGAASRGRKNQPRVDSKEKHALKVSTSKSRSSSSRTVPRKGSSTAAERHEAPTVVEEDAENSDVHEENTSKMAGSSSGTDEMAEKPLSSLFANQLDGSFKKSSLVAKTELLNKRKQVPFGGQLSKIDEEKAAAEASEPRRSNRRFQPTHRLLEGLQSSLIIPKMSSFSHDKGQAQKSRVRSASTRGK